MARAYYIAGETMVYVRGPLSSDIETAQELGLTEGPVRVVPHFRHRDMTLDAFGGIEGAPADIQVMLAWVSIYTDLIHFDEEVLQECTRLSMGYKPATADPSVAFGEVARAGTRLGNNIDTLTNGNSYIHLNLRGAQGRYWRFLHTYIANPNPFEWPLGTSRSTVQVVWRAVPYLKDPWSGATDGEGNPIKVQIWDNTLDDGILND